MGAPEITAFLNYLAEDLSVAASTQNQALNALVFLYKHVLERDVGKLEGLVRVKRPPKVPVVLTRAEVRAVCSKLTGLHRMLVLLLYGTGMRLQECLRLRVKDIDFERREDDGDLHARPQPGCWGGSEPGRSALRSKRARVSN